MEKVPQEQELVLDINAILRKYERAFLLSQDLHNLEGSFSTATITNETDEYYEVSLTYGIKQNKRDTVSITEKIVVSKIDYMVTIK